MASTTTLNFTADALEKMNYRELQACAKANGANGKGGADRDKGRRTQTCALWKRWISAASGQTQRR